ncbi:PAS-domain containing protein [Rhizobium bangladeshense]|uniref:histidine kinase n=1 Tax=Rhizobium bangladeshense TaxID=1138189 RepID=A0ABS7LJR9_9HYPH|nr:PAS-domain containing protein [Rhizobium bangladeshense]MBX4871226.1 PAS domain-containing protein [Rhizobium bangladeshense]MBX4874313.1 PAS domain-containing protein [Rhizobium bangladeshense]MBX4887783.1 PAS domain-containing protein [Rhizobium bangladeshense]MBY3591747.1 PAS-domain containing protein [Rhizobium bangladeshense]
MPHSFEAILENLPQGIVLLDSANTVTAFNSRTLDILGLPDGALRRGMNIDGLPGTADCRAAACSRLTIGRQNTSQFALPDGRMISLTCAPSRNGSWILSYEDISTHIRAEHNLTEQHRRFDAALSNMPHGLCMFDSEKKLILCNASYARMYDLPDFLTQPGTPLVDILAYRSRQGNGPADTATYFDVVFEATARGAPASQNIALSDGRIIKITHNPMQNGGYVATHEDVTRTVRLAEELRHHHDQLEITVQSRTAEVERQARELERMLSQERNINQLQRQFVAMASHEFRTPLAIIDAAAQRLLRKGGAVEPEFLNDKVEQIRASVSRIVDLMESVLSDGRLDTGKIDISYDECALGALIRTCCERQSAISKTHGFVLDIDGLPEFIDADPRSLGQVFTNLLSNAVKYAPGRSEIRVAAWEDTGNVKVAISDDGVGIDAEDLPRLFQRYFRARTSTGIAGTGIGLNLVKQIVELHQGSIEVRSARGCGSTFTMTLPIKRAPGVSVRKDVA